MRAFVAIRLSKDSVVHLQQAQKRLEQSAPGVYSWTKLESIHLTLYFLGNVPESKIDTIVNALQSIEPEAFQLGWGGLVILPSLDVPKVLAAGVVGGGQALKALQRKIHDQMFPLAENKETRAFFPHATIGRLKRGVPPSAKIVKRAIADFKLADGRPEPVTQFELIRSELGNGSPIHETIATFPLVKPA